MYTIMLQTSDKRRVKYEDMQRPACWTLARRAAPTRPRGT